jgi:acyl-CoA thioesterase FadM
LNDQLVVETEMAELRRASTVWNQRILRSDDLIASQEVTAAVLGPTGRPMRIDAELRSAMTQFS